MKTKAFTKLLAAVLSFAMLFSLIPMMAVNVAAEDTISSYKYDQKFTNMVTSDIATSATGANADYFYTDGNFSDYGIVDDPDASSGQGKVLKVQGDTSKYAGYVRLDLKENLDGIVKLGFKVKVIKTASKSLNGMILRANTENVIGIAGDYFQVGWNTGRYSLGNIAKPNQWNTFTLYMDYKSGKMLAMDVNSTRLTGDSINGSQTGFGSKNQTELQWLSFEPISLGAAETVSVYYDDITIEEIEMPKLVSSSVQNDDTNVPWVNSIELMFNTEMDATAANNIVLKQGDTTVAKNVVVDGKRVLVRHANLTSNTPCTLTIPSTLVSATDKFALSNPQTISFTPADDFLAHIDFEHMNIDLANPSKSDVSLHGRTGYGIDFYANHSFTTSSSSDTLNGKSTVSVVEEDGNKAIKFTANNGGGGFFYIHLNQKLTGGLAEISFRAKVPDDTTGVWSQNFFQYNGVSLLGQDGKNYYIGWKYKDESSIYHTTSINSMHANMEWNTFKYIIDMDNKQIHLVVNEDTDREVKYYAPVIYSSSGTVTPPTEIEYLRIAPAFDGMTDGDTKTAYYDDIIVKRIPTPTSGLKFIAATTEGTLAAGQNVVIKATLDNGTADLRNATVIAALYSASGKMKEVKKSDIKLYPTENTDAEITMKVPATYVTGDVIRVFAVDSLGSLKALGASK